MISGLFRSNYDAYYGHSLRVPRATERSADKKPVAAQPTIADVPTGERHLESYRTHPYAQCRELVAARQAYAKSRRYGTIRAHLERALAGARSTGDALAVAQFSYDHVLVYSGRTWLGRDYSGSACPLLEEAGKRAIELTRTPHELSEVVRSYAAFSRTQSSAIIKDACEKAEQQLSDTVSLVAFANTLPKVELSDGRWRLLAKAILVAKTPVDLDLVARAKEGLSDPCGRLEWAIAHKRECPSDELVLNPWYAGVKGETMAR